MWFHLGVVCSCMGLGRSRSYLELHYVGAGTCTIFMMVYIERDGVVGPVRFLYGFILNGMGFRDSYDLYYRLKLSGYDLYEFYYALY